MSVADSGINFSNRIMENDTLNILTFDYIYNGGGVGIGDFNNDGLKDIFFSANMSGNQLYLNKGNLKFEDITTKAQISDDGRWHTAAIIIDINQDGLDDIYVPVSATKNSDSLKRENLLFINQGLTNEIPTFKEMAKEYGINDNGFSSGAAFFDYDNDGDLDLYVLTNVIDQTPNYYRKKLTDGSHLNTDRLYRNDFNKELKHPVYTDISKEAGILMEGYGLGINITDINRDGWKDIFITNDYAADDLLYINNKNGTFTNKASSYFKHTSNSAMGNDVVDINSDGLVDVFSLDMLPEYNTRKKVFSPTNNEAVFKLSERMGYTHQYMRNTLQLNSGLDSVFNEIGLISGIAETDWSWTPSIADFDNDGDRDLLITNGFPKDVTDRDFMSYRTDAQRLVPVKDLISKIPSVKISNYGFENTGNLWFENSTEKWGLNRPSYSSGAAFADLDNDGDLDYIVNNTNDSAFVYKNNTFELNENNYLNLIFKGPKLNPAGIGVIVESNIGDQKFIFENNPFRGYKSTVDKNCHIGLGNLTNLNEIKITWPDGKISLVKNSNANQSIIIDYKNAKTIEPELKKDQELLFSEFNKLNIKYSEYLFSDFNLQNLMPFKLSQQGPALAVSDVNLDGLDDFYMGAPKFKNGGLYLQDKNGNFQFQPLKIGEDSTKKISEETGVLFFDADGDNDPDLYIASGGNEDSADSPSYIDRFFINDGKGNFIENKTAFPPINLSSSCVKAADIDGDGDLDLFVGGRLVPYQYPKATKSTIYINESKNGIPKFIPKNIGKYLDLHNFGLITDALFTDFDNDSDFDLFVLGDYNSPTLFKNNKGNFEKYIPKALDNHLGYWTSINGGDFDNDGDTDYILGNIGENLLLKCTFERPATIISGDFDNNGVYDIIPFCHYKNENGKTELVPYSGKEDVSRMYNPIRTRFNTYNEFSKATIENVLTKEEMSTAEKNYLNFTKSIYIENLGNNEFKVHILPEITQISPINGIIVQDFDQDGYLDFLYIANNFETDIMLGRLDSSNGMFMKGNGKGDFKPVYKSGFVVAGNARALALIALGSNQKMGILASQNNDYLKTFYVNKEFKSVDMPQKKNYISFSFKGKKYKQEIYNGASYLSQGSNKIFVPKMATEIYFR